MELPTNPIQNSISPSQVGGLPAANNVVADKSVVQKNNLSQVKESFSARPRDLVNQMGNRLTNIAAKLSSGDPLKGFASGLGSDLGGGVDTSSALSTMANLQTALSQASGSTSAMINSPNLQPIA